jgi:hypothetical protein
MINRERLGFAAFDLHPDTLGTFMLQILYVTRFGLFCLAIARKGAKIIGTKGRFGGDFDPPGTPQNV